MKAVFGFLASTAGRAARAIAGLILIAVGFYAVGGTWGWVLMIIGLVPLAAGLLDFCVFAPLFRYPFSGQKLRDALEK
jgi:uncharacterized protein (DUF58 family)